MSFPQPKRADSCNITLEMIASILSPILYTPKSSLSFIKCLNEQVIPAGSKAKCTPRFRRDLKVACLGRLKACKTKYGRTVVGRASDASSQVGKAGSWTPLLLKTMVLAV